MDNSPIPAKASLSRAMQHLAQGEQEADKALGALTIALMCEEGNIPADTETLDRLRACLFDALNGGSDQVKVLFCLSSFLAEKKKKLSQKVTPVRYTYSSMKA